MNSPALKKVLAVSLALSALILASCGELSDRGDFSKAVEGKSDKEVQKNVGKPASIDNSNPERVTWTYTSRTFDQANNNKRDAKTLVVFRTLGNGQLQVAEIKYE